MKRFLIDYRANGEKGSVTMDNWKPLDLSSSRGHPAPGELVALRLTPCNGKATLYKSPRYDIGVFKLDTNTGRKLWWHGTHGCEDPVRLKKHYDIWWCAVQPFDTRS